MRRSIFSLIFLWLAVACSSSPEPAPQLPPPSDGEWKTLVRAGSADDEVLALALLDDGTIAVAGYENGAAGGRLEPEGDSRAFISFHRPDGSTIREKLIDTAGSDVIDVLLPDPESRDLFAVGRTTGALGGASNAGQFDLFAAVIDPRGERADHFAQLGTLYPQHPRRVKQDARGGLLIAGNDDLYVPSNYVDRWSDPLLVRFDVARGSGGTELSYDWYRTRDTLYGDSYSGVADEGSTKSIFVAGNVETGPGAFVEKRDEFDRVLWSAVISPHGIDAATDLEVAPDGNLLVTGATFLKVGEYQFGQQDVFVVKIDAGSGAVLWSAQVGSGDADYPFDMVVDARGHIFVTGETVGAFGGGEYYGSFDVFVAELDETGRWIKSFQWGTEEEERATAIALDGKQRVLIGGYSYGQIAPGMERGGRRDAFVVEAKLTDVDPVFEIQAAFDR